MRNYFMILAVAFITSCGSPLVLRKDGVTPQQSQIQIKKGTSHGKIPLTTVSTNSKFPCELSCSIDEDPSAKHTDILIVTVSVSNHTDSPVTLVKSANFYSISVSAADRNKGVAENHRIVEYPPATEKQLLRVPAGGTAKFGRWFHYSRKATGELWVSEFYGGEEAGYMRIWDSKIRVEFSYGWYPDYLPESVPASTEPYVKEEISAYAVFPAL